MPRQIFAAFTLAWAVLLAGCNGAPAPSMSGPGEFPEPTPSPTNARQQVIAALLAADAATPTMTDVQKAVLLEVMRGKDVSFEQYKEAVESTLKCAEDAGLVIDGPVTVERGGQPVVEWGWSDPAQPDGNPKLGEYCRNVHSFGIEQAYLNSDVAMETERLQLEEWRPGIVACYDEAGAPLEDPSTDIYALLDEVDTLAGDHSDAVTACIADLEIILGHAP